MGELKGICGIGELMSEDSCHKTWYKKEKGYKQLCKLSNDGIFILLWRAGCKSYLEDGCFVIDNLTKVCFHHYCMYLTCFDRKQKIATIRLTFMQSQGKENIGVEHIQ